MDYRLRIAIITFAMCALILYLGYGCAGVELQGVCRHEATYAVSVFGEKYPVRVALGELRVGQQYGDHAKGQALIAGTWEPLCVAYPWVLTCPADPAFTPDAFLSSGLWRSYIMVPLKENQ